MITTEAYDKLMAELDREQAKPKGTIGKMTQAQIGRKAGLSHSTFERMIQPRIWHTLEGNEAIEINTETVTALRNEGLSWGVIQCRGPLNPAMPYPFPAVAEGAVRRFYTEATGIEHVGLRVAKGGRFFAGEAKLYEGELKSTGTEMAQGTASDHEARIRQAEGQRLLKMGLPALKEEAISLGLKPTAKWTPAKLATEIQKARA